MREKVVLVIDDDPGVERLCKRVLERAEFEVVSSTDAKKGVAILKKAPIDLLLVDIRMPELDGFKVLELARKHKPDLAVVIMTGYGTVETAIQALRLGANGLILKPFEKAAELVESVERALRDVEAKREIARLQALQPLIQITRTLFSETQLKPLIRLILETVTEHLSCEHAGFYFRASDRDGFHLEEGKGTPCQLSEDDPTGNPIYEADEKNISVKVNLEETENPAYRSLLATFGLGSVMCAPLSQHSSGSSVLFAGRDEGAAVFSASDFEVFTILSRQATVALENARLYAELRDYVHQLEESQRALTQAEKMAAIGRLTASIAHEVNNPLQAVRNCLHLAMRQELSQEKRDYYIKMSQDELERLMDTIQQMLDFYRPSALDREKIDLNDLITGVLALLEKQIQKQHITVHQDLAPKLSPVFIVCNQIQQVIFNIILNAMEAMPEGGDLYISTVNNDQTREVAITIEDTGPGVLPEDREKIFEPFMSTKEHGTGLGLSVSYSILDTHGGKIELLDGLRKGACFRVSLPGLME